MTPAFGRMHPFPYPDRVPMHFLLFYESDEQYTERRKPYRAEHLRRAKEAVARGELVLGGAFADPADGGVLLFRGASREVAERFAQNDPYVTNGVVKKWWVREWTTVVGEGAEHPV
jgi:uncharacterized protein